MKSVLLIDNYDSFTFNLVHYLEEMGCRVDVIRNASAFDLSKYDGVVLSPGPGLPEESGQLMASIDKIVGRIPVLGVCLGMQALALHLGGELYNLDQVRHGRPGKIDITSGQLFKGIPAKIEVGLYHSWAVKDFGDFDTVASDQDCVMAIENLEKKVFGVQFHPESVMTPEGKLIISNFLALL